MPKPEEADLYLLCLNWNFYVDHGSISLAAEEVSHARKARKPLVVFSDGDFTANIPFPGAVLFQSSAYCSRRSVNGAQIFSPPSFINDYQAVYGRGIADVHQKNPLERCAEIHRLAGTQMRFQNWPAKMGTAAF